VCSFETSTYSPRAVLIDPELILLAGDVVTSSIQRDRSKCDISFGPQWSQIPLLSSIPSISDVAKESQAHHLGQGPDWWINWKTVLIVANDRAKDRIERECHDWFGLSPATGFVGEF